MPAVCATADVISCCCMLLGYPARLGVNVAGLRDRHVQATPGVAAADPCSARVSSSASVKGRRAVDPGQRAQLLVQPAEAREVAREGPVVSTPRNAP